MAYLRGDAEIRIMSIRGRGDRLLHTAGARIPRITFHPNGREILFLEKDEVRSLDLAGLTVRTVRQIRVPAAVDVSEDGRHLIVSTNLKGRHEIHTCLLPDGEWNTLGRGCSAAISPDGRVMTDNHFDHHYLRVLQTSFRRPGGCRPPGMTLDNEAWSNRPDWIAFGASRRTTASSGSIIWAIRRRCRRPSPATPTGRTCLSSSRPSRPETPAATRGLHRRAFWGMYGGTHEPAPPRLRDDAPPARPGGGAAAAFQSGDRGAGARRRRNGCARTTGAWRNSPRRPGWPRRSRSATASTARRTSGRRCRSRRAAGAPRTAVWSG
ncbi:MAG: hypothetical protein U1G05_16290 [Kiritimatiellia bacterium]